MPKLLSQFVIAQVDRLGEIRRELGVPDDVPDLSPFSHQVAEVVRIQVFEDFFDFIFNARVLQVVAVGIGGDGEAIGNTDALLMELLIHLP